MSLRLLRKLTRSARNCCVAVLTVCATLGTAAGQQSIVGRIQDATTGNALAEVSITIKDRSALLKESATSGTTGDFSLVALPPGDYEVTVSREGYLTERFSITLTPRQVLDLDVRLSAAKLESHRIEVTASTTHLDPGRAQTSVALNQKDFRELPASHQVDIPKLVTSLVPGAILGHDNLVHLKGNELSLHQCLDGVAFLDNPQHHFSPGYGTQAIESVNVITGGMPAEFGNRLGGVLDIVTKSGRTFQGGSLSLGGSTIVGRRSAVEYGAGGNKWDAYLFSSGFSDGRFLNPPQTREIHDLAYGSRSFLKIGYLASQKDRLSLAISAGGANLQLPATTEEWLVGLDSSRRTRETSAILRWQRTLSPRALLSTSLYQRYTSNRLIPTSDPVSPFARGFLRTLTQGVKVDALVHTGNHNIKMGVDLAMFSPNEDLAFDPRELVDEHGDEHAEDHEGEVVHSEIRFGLAQKAAFAASPSFPPRVFTGVEVEALNFRGRRRGGEGSIYIQDRFSPFPNFTVHAGVRYDRYSLVVTDDLVSPRLGLSYHLPRTGTVFRAVYNRYFVPPPLEYIQLASAFGTGGIEPHGEEHVIAALVPGAVFSGGGDHEKAAKLFGPVRSLTQHYFEFGIQQPLNPSIVLDVSSYHHQGRNAYENVELSSTRVFLPTTFDGERTWGSDLSLRLKPPGTLGLFGYLNYSHMVTNFFGPVSGGLSGEGALPGQQITPAFDQRHTGSASLGYRHRPSGSNIGFATGYGSGTPTELGHGERIHGLQSAAHLLLPGHVLASGGGAGASGTAVVRLPSHWTFDVWGGATVWKSESKSVDLEFNVENVGNRIFGIAKESETTPIQYSGRRRFSGQFRFRF